MINTIPWVHTLMQCSTHTYHTYNDVHNTRFVEHVLKTTEHRNFSHRMS